jgi:hypothetical protein
MTSLSYLIAQLREASGAPFREKYRPLFNQAADALERGAAPEPMREALQDLLTLCLEQGDFKNGVTAPDGRDEGEYWAIGYFDKARAALNAAPAAVCSEEQADIDMALRKRVAEFLLEHDPFGDVFSHHEIDLIEGRKPLPLSDPYEITARNAGWTLVPDEFGGIFERSASDELERVHFNGDWKQLCEFADLEVNHG